MREKLMSWGGVEGEPERLRKPRRARVPPGINHSGGEEGRGCLGRKKPLKRRCKAEEVLG